jgi:hypothetical protein
MPIHALGPFRLDTQDDLLLRGSEPAALGRRAIALLRALVERPGALVSKDALIEAAWPGQAVEESNLTVQIAALRRVLGEARRRPLDRDAAPPRLSLHRASRHGSGERPHAGVAAGRCRAASRANAA